LSGSRLGLLCQAHLDLLSRKRHAAAYDVYRKEDARSFFDEPIAETIGLMRITMHLLRKRMRSPCYILMRPTPAKSWCRNRRI
jgi:hypothetical protein